MEPKQQRFSLWYVLLVILALIVVQAGLERRHNVNLGDRGSGIHATAPHGGPLLAHAA